MMNWIQEIVPQIKDKKGDLNTRFSLIALQFEDALRYSGHRNLAGEMFRSLNQFKYAQPFLADFAVYLHKNMSASNTEKILALVPDLYTASKEAAGLAKAPDVDGFLNRVTGQKPVDIDSFLSRIAGNKAKP